MDFTRGFTMWRSRCPSNIAIKAQLTVDALMQAVSTDQSSGYWQLPKAVTDDTLPLFFQQLIQAIEAFAFEHGTELRIRLITLGKSTRPDFCRKRDKTLHTSPTALRKALSI